MHRTIVDAFATVWLDFMLKMRKVKDSRIQGLWIYGGQWVIPWKLIVAASGAGRSCLSLPRKWSWLGEAAALWSRLSPAMDTSHIVPPTHFARSTQQLRLLDLSEI